MLRNPFRKEPDDLEAWLVSPRGAIRREKVTPERAFARWQAHRAAFPTTGLWPVIVPGEYVEGLEQSFADQSGGVEDAVAMGLSLDVGDYFSGALEELNDGFEEEDEEYKQDLEFDPPAPNVGSLTPVDRQILTLNDSAETRDLKAGLWIALLPCREPWEAPAVLGYGAWNDCPMPAEHVAVFREWHRRHGAEPLVMGHDTVELLVRPIQDPEEAKRTAVEQYAYCPDIVDQGIGSVLKLAEALLGASVWFFWWD